MRQERVPRRLRAAGRAEHRHALLVTRPRSPLDHLGDIVGVPGRRARKERIEPRRPALRGAGRRARSRTRRRPRRSASPFRHRSSPAPALCPLWVRRVEGGWDSRHVRLGPFTDITPFSIDVRSTPESGHSSARESVMDIVKRQSKSERHTTRYAIDVCAKRIMRSVPPCDRRQAPRRFHVTGSGRHKA